eukprot:CAMPEP_0170190886 /NCGR_PEP_ID=MMETSP0040_2-20121228/50354_1 /TAXON_ID=641309 /ORGANISM="Lotharella oceanica, Strain CCMP622" /LENGTH=55 /DNA_ID=CAMNT_0010438847 /DNA_START=278 /DNA_END=445 /DNA_ORIENTATION=+
MQVRSCTAHEGACATAEHDDSNDNADDVHAYTRWRTAHPPAAANVLRMLRVARAA